MPNTTELATKKDITELKNMIKALQVQMEEMYESETEVESGEESDTEINLDEEPVIIYVEKIFSGMNWMISGDTEYVEQELKQCGAKKSTDDKWLLSGQITNIYKVLSKVPACIKEK